MSVLNTGMRNDDDLGPWSLEVDDPRGGRSVLSSISDWVRGVRLASVTSDHDLRERPEGMGGPDGH